MIVPPPPGPALSSDGYDAAVSEAGHALHGGSILLVVIDGLGGMADAEAGTELEEARTPNLDRLALEGVTGLLEPVGPGVTPGSGPGHLALFGYDPLAFELGRGTLSAAGLGFELRPGDVAARGNLCTLDGAGNVVDRRAGRPSDDEARRVIDRLQAEIRIEGVEIFLRPERGHRLLVVLRGEGLDPRVSDTDPQTAGRPPLDPVALDLAAERTARVARVLTERAREVLAGEPSANGLLLRGFDSHRELPSFAERYGLRPAAVAVYPMYRGIASLLGFEVLGPPSNLEDQVRLWAEHAGRFDYVFFHHKDADAAGEDGDRAAKVAAIERLDAAVPDLLAAGPDVVAVTGDHATPSQMAAHSWHPVPLLVHGPRCGRDEVERFGERWCLRGGLGRRPSKELMPILLGNAGRLAKYGA
jgi:2,3-bisphosphoglycerate-independent phosphoglycerate mutase